MTGEPVAGPRPLSDEELAREPRRLRAKPCARTALDDDYYPRARPASRRSTCRCSRRQLGRHGPAPARQFRGLCARRLAHKWLEAHGDTHWTHFYTNTARLQKRFFGHFLKGEDTGWDQQPRVQLQHPPSRRAVRRAPRERVAARAHAMDQILPRAGDMRLDARSPARRRPFPTRPRATGSLPHAAADRGDRDHRAGGGESCSSRPTRPMPTSSWCCACSRPTARRWCSSAPTIRARRSGSAGCAPRTASSTRPLRCPIGPGIRMTRNGRSPGRAGRARHRDLADLHRGAARLSPRRSRCAARTTNTTAPTPLEIPGLNIR